MARALDVFGHDEVGQQDSLFRCWELGHLEPPPVGSHALDRRLANTRAKTYARHLSSAVASLSSSRLAWNSTRVILPSRKVHTEPEINSTSTFIPRRRPRSRTRTTTLSPTSIISSTRT